MFPGLLFRRLYFYGEFLNEFNSGHNLVSLLAVSVIPGLIIVILSFLSYCYLFTEIDLSAIIDKFKDINNPAFRLKKSNDIPLNEVIFKKVDPFVGFQYLLSIILGLLLGRIIRITRIDTKFKMLRFKNSWFYIFNGQQTGFKKLKNIKERDKKHLFTKADILIDSNSTTLLYSGIVVDYELNDNDCSTLSKVFVKNVERYSSIDGKRVPVEIHGALLVVDCSAMKNINLTYIYEETKSILKSKLPNSLEIIFGLAGILLIPLFTFRTESINLEIYDHYFGFSWYKKIPAYLLTIQIINILNPFIKEREEYKFVTLKSFIVKLVLISVLFLSLLLLK